MVNPFEETGIAGGIPMYTPSSLLETGIGATGKTPLTPHQRVQAERDLRINEVQSSLPSHIWDRGRQATQYVDWKYPPVFGGLTPGESGHPYMGGYGPEHKWARPQGGNPFYQGLQTLRHTVGPKIRDILGFPEAPWVKEYINRDVPQIEDEGLMKLAKGVTYRDPRIEKMLQELQGEQGYTSIGIGSQNFGETQTRDERDLELRWDTLDDQGQQLYDLYLQENPDADKEKVMEFLQKKYTDEQRKTETQDFWDVDIALNLQEAMDAHEVLGLPLNTDRFRRRANKAGVQVTNRGGLMSLV